MAIFHSCVIRKLYILCRVMGYLCGLAGVVLFTLGRQAAEPRSLMTLSGGVLLIACFACFLATYILYIVARLVPRKGPEKGS